MQIAAIRTNNQTQRSIVVVLFAQLGFAPCSYTTVSLNSHRFLVFDIDRNEIGYILGSDQEYDIHNLSTLFSFEDIDKCFEYVRDFLSSKEKTVDINGEKIKVIKNKNSVSIRGLEVPIEKLREIVATFDSFQ